MLFGLVWFFEALFQVSVLSRGGGWVGEIKNKANSAEAEAEALLGLAELGNIYLLLNHDTHYAPSNFYHFHF